MTAMASLFFLLPFFTGFSIAAVVRPKAILGGIRYHGCSPQAPILIPNRA